jgi:hypothetical protein
LTGLALVGLSNLAYGQNAGLGVTGGGAAKRPRFGGLHFDFTVANGSGLNAVGQNYRNDFTFYLEPSWSIGQMYLRNSKYFKNLTLAARLLVNQNVSGIDPGNFTGDVVSGPQGTCWDGNPSTTGGVVDAGSIPYCNPTPGPRRAAVSDLWLTLRAPAMFRIPKIDVTITPQFRVILPTSQQSQFQNLAMSLTGFLGLGRAFWKGRIRIGYSFGFNGFARTSYYASVNPSPIGAAAQGGNPWEPISNAGISNIYSDPSRLGVDRATAFTVMNIVSGGINFHPQVGFNLLYFTINGFLAPQACQGPVVAGQQVDVCDTTARVAGASGIELSRPGAQMPLQVLWASIGYEPLDYLGLTLSWINVAPMFYADGTYRQGVVSTDYNAFTTVMLGATLTVDALFNKLIPEKKQEPPKAAVGPGLVPMRRL